MEAHQSNLMLERSVEKSDPVTYGRSREGPYDTLMGLGPLRAVLRCTKTIMVTRLRLGISHSRVYVNSTNQEFVKYTYQK